MNPAVRDRILDLCRGSGHLLVLGRICRPGGGLMLPARLGLPLLLGHVLPVFYIFRAARIGVSPWHTPCIWVSLKSIHCDSGGRNFRPYAGVLGLMHPTSQVIVCMEVFLQFSPGFSRRTFGSLSILLCSPSL